ncbi:hypothetical protein OIU85_010820 [Salix viminalis]|uniref:Uncharacterized protein n=1 Tax=Salix viminalis TaxID=40686 RepID=A0A9Q0NRH1_SALVM|nr:hypothetical protein OIU85_010820 [Salix viminalis]
MQYGIVSPSKPNSNPEELLHMIFRRRGCFNDSSFTHHSEPVFEMRLTGHHGIRRQSTFPGEQGLVSCHVKVDFVDEQHQVAGRSQKGRVRFNVSVPGQARVTREHGRFHVPTPSDYKALTRQTNHNTGVIRATSFICFAAG